MSEGPSSSLNCFPEAYIIYPPAPLLDPTLPIFTTFPSLIMTYSSDRTATRSGLTPSGKWEYLSLLLQCVLLLSQPFSCCLGKRGRGSICSWCFSRTPPAFALEPACTPIFLSLSYLFFFKILFIYLREREIDKQTHCWVQSLMWAWYHDPETMTWAKIKSSTDWTTQAHLPLLFKQK